MPNTEQLRLIKEAGVAAWNAHLERPKEDIIESFFDGQIIEKPPQTQIRLSGADLSGAFDVSEPASIPRASSCLPVLASHR